MHKPDRPANANVRAAMRTAVPLSVLGLCAILTVDVPPAARAETTEARARIEGEPRPRRRTSTGIRIASLERAVPTLDDAASLAGASVVWRASAACLNETLRKVIGEVAASFGPVTINSTCRSPVLNARVGGARHSRHLTGDAVDFGIAGDKRAVLKYLQGHHLVGGLKLYEGGHFHIDTGPRRTW